jgi:hypothetical protein
MFVIRERLYAHPVYSVAKKILGKGSDLELSQNIHF